MAVVNQQFKLHNGRLLGYDEYGMPDGKPLFYFHGTPSSRIEWQLFGSEALTNKLKLRVIALDRPGLGLSDFQPDRTFGDWPADVTALADGLKIERFAVLGGSGGGPYAAACALKIPERLTNVGILCGVGPHNEPGLTDSIDPNILQFDLLARDQPALARAAFEQMAVMVRTTPDSFIVQSLAALPEPDKAVLARPEAQQAFIAMVREALRGGPQGVQWDTALMVSPWDFRPHDIRMAVYLWYGELDTHAPPAVGHYLVAAIPESHATFYPKEGHLSLMYNHPEEILGVLTA